MSVHMFKKYEKRAKRYKVYLLIQVQILALLVLQAFQVVYFHEVRQIRPLTNVLFPGSCENTNL